LTETISLPEGKLYAIQRETEARQRDPDREAMLVDLNRNSLKQAKIYGIQA
jgi:hypothetical protein